MIAAGLAIFFFARSIADLTAAWSIRWAERRNLLAEVNERSSHKAPTPRVGGIGLMAGVCAVFALVAFLMVAGGAVPFGIAISPEELDWLPFAGIVFPAALAFALGFFDDQSDPPALLKLGGQLLIAIIPPICGLRVQYFHIPPMTEIAEVPYLLSIALSAGWILLVMNAVNFMDGINGLAGRFAFWLGGFLFFIGAFISGASPLIPLGAGLAGAAHGFLKHNFPTAKTFMGDCGSQPLGFLAAAIGLLAGQFPTTFPITLTAYSLIISVFLFDVLYTLIRRTMQGENLLKAHRSHLYQRHLIATGENHAFTHDFLEMRLIITGFLGTAYVVYGSAPGNTILQAAFLAGVAATLADYAIRTFQAEKRVQNAA